MIAVIKENKVISRLFSVVNEKNFPDCIFLEIPYEIAEKKIKYNAETGSVVEDASKDATEIYEEMVKDIYDQMLIVFGTKNDVSASAFAATWEAMKSRPANYVDIDLGFVDETRVIEFANSKLQAADEYAKFRMKRITQYELAKGAINV